MKKYIFLLPFFIIARAPAMQQKQLPDFFKVIEKYPVKKTIDIIKANPYCYQTIIKNEAGDTLLQHAIRYRKTGVVRLLISRSTPEILNALNVLGNTPLHQAAYWNNRLALQDLIERGADITKSNFAGRTVLNMAAHSNNVRLIEKILATNKINVNQHDLNRNTPLHGAIYYSSDNKGFNVVKKLVQHGALIDDIKNQDRKTPLDMALQKKQHYAGEDVKDIDEMIQFLQDRLQKRQWSRCLLVNQLCKAGCRDVTSNKPLLPPEIIEYIWRFLPSEYTGFETVPGEPGKKRSHATQGSVMRNVHPR